MVFDFFWNAKRIRVYDAGLLNQVMFLIMFWFSIISGMAFSIIVFEGVFALPYLSGLWAYFDIGRIFSGWVVDFQR